MKPTWQDELRAKLYKAVTDDPLEAGIESSGAAAKATMGLAAFADRMVGHLRVWAVQTEIVSAGLVELSVRLQAHTVQLAEEQAMRADNEAGARGYTHEERVVKIEEDSQALRTEMADSAKAGQPTRAEKRAARAQGKPLTAPHGDMDY